MIKEKYSLQHISVSALIEAIRQKEIAVPEICATIRGRGIASSNK